MENQYIFLNLMGGIGNQLFQYAAGLLQQSIYNGCLVLSEPTNRHDNNDYRLNIFAGHYGYTQSQLPLHIHTLYQEDPQGSWDPREYPYPLLNYYGYFQNIRCLTPVLPKFKTIILERLQPYKDTMLQRYIVTPTSGFIHVRRGDYLDHPTLFPILTDSYYAKALTHFPHITQWYILSEKLEDAHILLNTIPNSRYLDEKDPLHCLALMSSISGGAIIANSTFSWMGAYLGIGNTDKVVYPAQWQYKDCTSMFPSEWICI